MYCTFGQIFPPVPPVRNEQWINLIYDSEMKPDRNLYATFVANFRNSKRNQKKQANFLLSTARQPTKLKTIGACRESTGLVF
jgi:hypothetical protein